MNGPAITLNPSLLVLTALVMLLLALVGGVWAWTIVRLSLGKPLLTPAKPRSVRFGGGTILAVIVVVVATNLAAVWGYALIRARPATALPGAPRPSLSPQEQMVLGTIVNVILLPVLPTVLRATAGTRLTELGVTWREFGLDALRGGYAYLLLEPLVVGLLWASSTVWKPQKHPVEAMLRANPTGPIAMLALGSAVVLAPLVEELLFRGILQNWLTRVFRGESAILNDELITFEVIPEPPLDPVSEPAESATPTTVIESRPRPLPPLIPRLPKFTLPGGTTGLVATHAPNVLASAVFAALHVPQWPAPIPLFVLSLGMGYVYQRSGSLMAAVFMHAFFNGVSTSLLLLYLYSGAGTQILGLLQSGVFNI